MKTDSAAPVASSWAARMKPKVQPTPAAPAPTPAPQAQAAPVAAVEATTEPVTKKAEKTEKVSKTGKNKASKKEKVDAVVEVPQEAAAVVEETPVAKETQPEETMEAVVAPAVTIPSAPPTVEDWAEEVPDHPVFSPKNALAPAAEASPTPPVVPVAVAPKTVVLPAELEAIFRNQPHSAFGPTQGVIRFRAPAAHEAAEDTHAIRIGEVKQAEAALQLEKDDIQRQRADLGNRQKVLEEKEEIAARGSSNTNNNYSGAPSAPPRPQPHSWSEDQHANNSHMGGSYRGRNGDQNSYEHQNNYGHSGHQQGGYGQQGSYPHQPHQQGTYHQQGGYASYPNGGVSFQRTRRPDYNTSPMSGGPYRGAGGMSSNYRGRGGGHNGPRSYPSGSYDNGVAPQHNNGGGQMY